jgi:hypothetical protein
MLFVNANGQSEASMGRGAYGIQPAETSTFEALQGDPCMQTLLFNKSGDPASLRFTGATF